MKLPIFLKILFSVFTAVVLLGLAGNTPIEAQSSVSSTLDIVIDLTPSTANVTKTVVFKNNGGNTVGLSSYSLSLGTAEPENIKTTVNGTNVSHTQSSIGEQITINVDFNSAILQAGESKTLRITYTDGSIVDYRNGKYIAILPRLATNLSLGDISLKISAPQTWGQPNYSSIDYVESTTSTKFVYDFTQELNSEKDILIAFGDTVAYDMTLRHELINNEDREIIKTIAVPPDTDSQTVIWESLTVPPDFSYVDTDGNLILNYILAPGEEVTTSFSFQVIVQDDPDASIEPISQDDIFNYTKSDTFWGSDDPEIVSLATKITTGKNTNLEKADAILEYVKEILLYSEDTVLEEKVERKGGIGSINKPFDSICQNYVDLFVTLARSVNVPTRAVAGFAFPDTLTIQELPAGVLHSWVEVWDDTQGWVAIDPTWEDTSGLEFFDDLGVGRFTWVTYGNSSVAPKLPADYNLTSTTGLNTNTTVASITKTVEPEFIAKLQNTNINIFQGDGLILEVENTGNVALQTLSAEFNSDNISVSELTSSQDFSDVKNFKSYIVVPGENYEFNGSVNTGILQSLTGGQNKVKLSISANYGPEQVKEELEDEISLVGGITQEILLWLVAGVGFVFILVSAFLIRRMLYKKSMLTRKEINLTNRKSFG